MHEVVKYNNRLNDVVFKGFTDTELKLFFAICSQMKERGSEEVTFTFSQLKELTGEKRHLTEQEYSEAVQSMYHKLVHLSYIYNDGEDIAGEFNLFQGYERSLKEQTFTISVSPKYIFFFNSLTSEFTRFELEEFVTLNGKYAKLLYKHLRQWRSTGTYVVLMSDLKELLDVPENYETKFITSRIIQPSVDRLAKLPSFKNLQYKYIYNARKVHKVVFTWQKESSNMLAMEDDIDSAGNTAKLETVIRFCFPDDDCAEILNIPGKFGISKDTLFISLKHAYKKNPKNVQAYLSTVYRDWKKRGIQRLADLKEKRPDPSDYEKTMVTYRSEINFMKTNGYEPADRENDIRILSEIFGYNDFIEAFRTAEVEAQDINAFDLRKTEIAV